MRYTWKDEYLLIIFTVPLILAFIPSMVQYVEAGFEALEATPEWYRWLVTGMVVATFGLRWMFSKITFKGK